MISKQALMLLLNGLTLLLVLIGGISSSVAPGPQPPRSGVDLSRPKTAEDYKKDLNVMVGALIAIAQDEDQPGQTRTQAIFALGKINHPASLSFLLDHIDYRVSRWKYPGDTIALSDDQQAKRSPCRYALYYYADWNVVPLIQERLDQPRTEGELGSYSVLLDRRLSGEGTAALIAAELSKQPEGARKQNLQTLKGWYQQHHHFLRNLKEP